MEGTSDGHSATSKFKSWIRILCIFPGYKLKCRFVCAWNNYTGFRLGRFYSKWEENLALIFQLLLLTRITSQFEIQQQRRTLEFNTNPIWALSRVLFFLFKRKKWGKKVPWMCIHILPVGQFLWGYLWSIVRKAAEIQSKTLPSTQVTWCRADLRVGIPYGFSLHAVKRDRPPVGAHTLHNLRCCFMWRVPVGPHTPCTAQPGAGTRGAGQLLASPGRGLGHSSRSPLGTYAPWF